MTGLPGDGSWERQQNKPLLDYAHRTYTQRPRSPLTAPPEIVEALAEVTRTAEVVLQAQATLIAAIRAARAADASVRAIAAAAGVTHPSVSDLLAHPDRTSIQIRRQPTDV